MTRANWNPANSTWAIASSVGPRRLPSEIARPAQDLASGLLVTLPSERDRAHPEVGPYLARRLAGIR